MLSRRDAKTAEIAIIAFRARNMKSVMLLPDSLQQPSCLEAVAFLVTVMEFFGGHSTMESGIATPVIIIVSLFFVPTLISNLNK